MFGQPATENHSVSTVVNAYVFSNQGQIKATKGEDGQCAQDIVSGL